MAVKNKADLKNYFQTGDIPSQQNFEDLIDSFVHLTEGHDIGEQIKHTLHISGTQTYTSGSAPGIPLITHENEVKGYYPIPAGGHTDPTEDLTGFFTSSIS